MKIHQLLSTALIGAVALAFAGQTAHAALNYTAGDVFLGFQSATASDYLVNIGNVSQFANLAPGTHVTVNTGGSISGDLSSTFGSTWYADNTVSWSLTGTTYNGSTDLSAVLFATRARSNATIQSIPWIGRSNSGQVESVGLLQELAGKYAQDGVAAGTPTATLQDIAAANSYAKLTAGTSDFAIGGSVEGKTGSTLDFYRIDPVDGQSAAYLGYFTIANTGVVTFTAVPEPSTTALIGVAAAVTIVILRRRAKSSALLS